MFHNQTAITRGMIVRQVWQTSLVIVLFEAVCSLYHCPVSLLLLFAKQEIRANSRFMKLAAATEGSGK